jgi:hypothetical protein
MSVDDRIRGGMIANATAHQPAVESSLDKVRGRGRRAQTRRLMMAAGSVAAGSVAAVAATVLILASPDAPDRSGPTTPAPSATSALFGRYESDVTSPAQLAGRWVLELGGNGTITVIPPDGYAGVVSGTLLSADGTTLRTNLFEQDVCANLGNGEFHWTREGARLALRVGHDPCAPRRTFFTENRWVAVSGS